MAETTSIQWTDHTFNPWIGCMKVAPGCEHCYAEADMDHRLGRAEWGPLGTRSRTSDAYWKQPLKWNRDAAESGTRRRVFCASLSDVFEAWDGPIVDAHGVPLHYGHAWASKEKYVPQRIYIGQSLVTMDDIRRDLFALIAATPHLDWLLLTKRPQNIAQMIRRACRDSDHYCGQCGRGDCTQTPCFPNIWLGTSISDQATADKAISALLKCRDLSPVLFLSAEPLLGPVDLDPFLWPFDERGRVKFEMKQQPEPHGVREPLGLIDWIIVGGESGPHARSCRQTWIREIVRQCQDSETACFVKQFGSNAEEGFGVHRKLKFKDPKGGDPLEWPEDLRVRAFPLVAVNR